MSVLERRLRAADPPVEPFGERMRIVRCGSSRECDRQAHEGQIGTVVDGGTVVDSPEREADD